MSTRFWIKRALLVFAISFSIIFIVQYFKSTNLSYSFTQAALWGVLTSAVYVLVLWNKLRKNSSCAVASQQEKDK